MLESLVILAIVSSSLIAVAAFMLACLVSLLLQK